MEKETMLKVVGASWYKTKISSLIILSAMMLALGALFIIDMERPEFDGNYCATAYWTHATGFKVEYWGQSSHLMEIPRGVARICYHDNIGKIGWPQLEIESNPDYPDKVQAFAAGVLEGALTWKSIYDRWESFNENTCEKDEESQKFCEWLREVAVSNYENLRKQFKIRLSANQNDMYLHQVNLFYQQLEGFEFGWKDGLKRSAFKRSGLEIPLTEFLLLNMVSDIKDLHTYYFKMVAKSAETPLTSNTSQQKITLNLLDESVENLKFNLEHNSRQPNPQTFRIVKKYKLFYHFAGGKPKNHPLIPGQNIVFTSYPGVIYSPDSFYTVSGRQSRLIVAGIELEYNREALSFDDLNLDSSIFLGPRLMAANRLSTNAKSWSKFLTHNPSSGSMQWAVVDRQVLKKMALMGRDNKQLIEVIAKVEPESEDIDNAGAKIDRMKSFVWLVNQLPGRVHGEDRTEHLLKENSIQLKGIPDFEEMFEISGLTEINTVPTVDKDDINTSFVIGKDIVIEFVAATDVDNEYVEHVSFRLLNDDEPKISSPTAVVPEKLLEKPPTTAAPVSFSGPSKLTDDSLFEESVDFWRFDSSSPLWAWS